MIIKRSGPYYVAELAGREFLGYTPEEASERARAYELKHPNEPRKLPVKHSLTIKHAA